MRQHIVSFKLAFSGVWYAVRSQPNFAVHIYATIFALSLGLMLNISELEWLVIILTIVLVFTTEMINTAIESMTDLITKEYHVKAKIAKDVSAGMVLLSAIGSVIIGIIIFGPKLLNSI